MRIVYRNISIFILLQFLLISQLVASVIPPISHLGIEQGLSNNSIRCIYQDHNGFMWFGTYDGLNRYDGYQFKVFRNKINDTNSLPHNYIYTIAEDRLNNIWVGTGQGIGIYNNIYSDFRPAYYFPYQTKRREKITVNVTSIKIDTGNNVFIGTNGGGLLAKLKGDDMATQVPLQNGTSVNTTYNVRALEIDSHKSVWLFIQGIGLCRYNYQKKQIQVVNSELKSANLIEADARGNLWMGTTNGLYKYSIESNSLVKLYNEERGKLSSNNIESLSFDKQGNLWIGTEGGINILNVVSDKIDYLLHDESKSSLSSESVFSIYTDKESRIWIGTIKGGIDIVDVQKNQFQLIAHNALNKNSLSNNFVSSFYEDKARNIWIGTDGGGLCIWNRNLNSFTKYKHEIGNANSLSNNSVTSIREDYLNNIWISTFGGGINRFNKLTGSFEKFKCINSAKGEENIDVWQIFEDKSKNLWACTFGNGKLYLFNRQLNKFEVFDPLFNDLIAITEDKNGGLWAGNSFQLFKIDTKNKKHLVYEIGKPIRSLLEDKKGNFWIGTEGGGLILFDTKSGKIVKRYSGADGLCNNSVLNILEDEKGELWLSTFNGLSRFNPENKIFKNFYQSDGLQSNQFAYSAALKLQSGAMVFGGINGFNLFFPDSIHPRVYMPPVFFTGFRINNKPLSENNKYVNRFVNDQVEEFKIPYSEAFLSFDFSALEYTSPTKINYAYKLEGWDNDWNYTGNTRTITYNNLREGHYLLKIRSTNSEGAWNDTPTVLKISVMPPWYRSLVAYLLYLSIIGALIYFYLRYKHRQTRLEYEIKVAHLNAEKEKEINEKRFSLFTNISHEFRTPLTLIINPVKDLLQKYGQDNEVEHRELNVVYRNARRLLSLVDQLLLFRKAENEVDNLTVVRLNFYELCKEVYLCFIQQAKSKNIEYVFDYTNEGLEIFADREKLEIILYNLISNALKYTPNGGKVIFKISESENAVDVYVIDNGYGIPDDVGSKLFEKFYQLKRKEIPALAGFGIGLYLVKYFVDSLKGKVSFESTVGKGTTFKVTLLKGKQHFGSRQIFKDADVESVILEELSVDDAPIGKITDPKVENYDLKTLVKGTHSILVVDDNEQMRNYIGQMFQDEFVLYLADNGEECLQLAQQYQPDIIISDVFMQGMSGIELCKSIKDNPELSHIHVILLTGSSSSDVKLKGVEGGADDYLTKPFEKDLLIARVSSLLKSRTNLQKYFFNEITLKPNNLKISEEDKAFIDRCIKIVESHLDEDNFNIKKLSLEIGMSHSNLYKKIKSVSGQSVNGFVRFIRLRKAAELLIKTEDNITQVALLVGFNDMKYFREQFNKLFKVNPSEYVKKYRKVLGNSNNYRVTKENDL